MEAAKVGLGKRLTEALDARGWSQKNLALELGYEEATVSRYCNDKATPSIPDLQRIGAALGVSPCFLAFGDEVQPARSADEREAVRLVRRLPDDRRAAVLAALAAVAGMVPSEELRALEAKQIEKQRGAAARHVSAGTLRKLREDAVLLQGRLERSEQDDRLKDLGASVCERIAGLVEALDRPPARPSRGRKAASAGA